MQHVEDFDRPILTFFNTLQSKIFQSMALSLIDHLQLVDFGVEKDDIREKFLKGNNCLIDHPESWLI